MSLEIDYKKASKEDIELLINSRIEFLIGFWGVPHKEEESVLRNSLRQFFNESIPKESYICYLAYHKNEFAGVGGMVIKSQLGSFRVPNGLVGFIMNMYTIPKFRNNGICNTILNKLIEEGRAKEVSFFELHASKEGEPIYVKNNFILHTQPTYRKIFKG